MYLVNFLNLQTAEQLFVAANRFRSGQKLVGAKDGVNVTFKVPGTDKFTHNLPYMTIAVYVNGIRLSLIDDYTVAESGGSGTGYDSVILEWAPRSNDKILADYIAVGA